MHVRYADILSCLYAGIFFRRCHCFSRFFRRCRLLATPFRFSLSPPFSLLIFFFAFMLPSCRHTPPPLMPSPFFAFSFITQVFFSYFDCRIVVFRRRYFADCHFHYCHSLILRCLPSFDAFHAYFSLRRCFHAFFAIAIAAMPPFSLRHLLRLPLPYFSRHTYFSLFLMFRFHIDSGAIAIIDASLMLLSLMLRC